MTQKAFWVVVPAAGSGQRFGAALPKQYQRLGAQPILMHTLSALLGHPRIAGVQLALAADDPHWATMPLAADPRVRTCVGGATRADSVMAALLALESTVPAAHQIWVHDAARPLLPRSAIDRLCAALDEQAGGHSGALLALPVRDTVKQTIAGAKLPLAAQTLDRERLWLAQTPQVFVRGALIAALREAAAAGVAVTDEAQAMERKGHFARLVEGDPRNLKITTPVDLALARLYLEQSLTSEGSAHADRHRL